VVVGSNLHIFCGAAEIRRVVSGRAALRLDLTDAGARSGDLFVYSRWPLVLDAASGCVVTGIAQAGEYVWRIGLAERQRGVAQRVALKVMLPVTQQLWFWLLIAMVVVSLVFTGWRYLVGLRLQREHALDRERARIARDMHDDMGSTLARILMLSETSGTPLPPGVGQLAKIHQAALEMTRAMDEIVWAVNPRNDWLDRLAMYLDAYAQELLDPAGVESRVDFPSPLPQRSLSAPVRHNLFQAFKEALTNLLRHAGARRVFIELTEQASGFVLSIEDDAP
jgi:signal transduction histidine kinase